jgi:hypothetical protein
MLISELLKENTLPKPTSKLASAPSINDEPSDEVSDEPEDTEVDDGGDLDAVKNIGGSLGKDLYSVTVYNTQDNFANIDQDIKNADVLEQFDNETVQAYLRQSSASVGNEKAISCLIMNARNGEFIAFNSGEDGQGFDTGIEGLASSGIIDADQVNILRDISALGKKYNHVVNRVDWRPGTEAEGNSADMLYNILDRLKAALSLKEPVDKIKNVYISPEQKAKNKAWSDQALSDLGIVRKKKDTTSSGGAGRDMR